jgi:hypothetical protein
MSLVSLHSAKPKQVSKKYNIAICISGFLRSWQYTSKSFREILCADKNCNFDIFVHTYKQNYFEFSSQKSDEVLSDDDIIKMFNNINVKVFIIEDRNVTLPEVKKSTDYLMNKYKCSKQYHNVTQVPESSDNKTDITTLSYRIYDQLRKVQACNKLRKQYQDANNIKYDFVVKTRFDVVYLTKPIWSNILDNHLYIGDGAFLEGTIDDIIAIGKSNVINIYSSRLNEFINGTYLTLCPHNSIYNILSKYKIKHINKYILYKVLRSRYLVHNTLPTPHTGAIDSYTESFL